MIDDRVRDVVGDHRPGTDACAADERVDRIAALDHAINMLQAALHVETAIFAKQRRAEDIADGIETANAGRDAASEIGMARRVSKTTIEHQLASGAGG